MNWLWLFLGGGIGTLLRVVLGSAVQGPEGSSFPWGTLCVNGLGCLLIGILATMADERALLSDDVRAFLVVGVLGGFTTFSTFGLETQRLIENGAISPAIAYALSSVVLGVLAAFAGVGVVRILG